MTSPLEEKEQFLKDRGWFMWYNKDYWCHEKTIKDKTRQDCTYYGFSLEDAIKYENKEINNGEPFSGAFLGLRFK